MAFSEINVDRLRSSIEQCKNSLNYEESKEIFESELNSACNTSAISNMQTSIDKLVTMHYKQLFECLDDYLLICDDIEKYKNLEIENTELTNRYNSISVGQFYKETYEQVKYDPKTGKQYKQSGTRTVEDYRISREMENILEQIEQNKSEMETICINVSEKVSNG